ncbi:MAG: choice-of-anchor L domain-containing protein [Flavobacteriales bacterium]
MKWRILHSIPGIIVLLMAVGRADLAAQMIINTTQVPTTLVQNVLLGAGVFASNVTFNGAPGVNFPTDIDRRIARFNGTNCNVGLAGGVVLHSGDVSYVPGPNDEEVVGAGGIPFNGSPDADLAQVAQYINWQLGTGAGVYNKSVLEFDFIPLYDMVRFRYVFSSEEYERWTCLEYNDAFGFFLSGPGISGPFNNNAINLALVPGTMTPVGVNTVNSGMVPNNANYGDALNPFGGCFNVDPNWFQNTEYYIYNGGVVGGLIGGPQTEEPYCCDPYYIQHNGLTVVLEATAAVQCGQQYHIKLALADIGDFRVPSAVYIEQGSFTSTDRFSMDVAPGPNVEFAADDTTFIENDCDSVYLRFHRWGGFYLDEDVQITVAGTSTAGVDYSPVLPSQVHFNQFDSTVVVPIAVPVDGDGVEDLIITIVTCDGLKLQTYTYRIDQRAPITVQLDDVQLDCPATVTLAPLVSGGGNAPSEYTYLWNTGETTPSITVAVEESTQFWVTVDDCWSMPVTDSAWVLIPEYQPLTITLTPDTAIPCLATAELEVLAVGGAGDYTYAWTLNNVLEGTDPQLEVPAATPPVYHVVTVTDLCGVEVLDSVRVSQAPPLPLTITLTPDTAIPCLGNADLEVVVEGGGGDITIVWRDGSSVVGNEAVLNVPASELSVYEVEVTDQCGQTVTGQVEVTTAPPVPLTITLTPDTAIPCLGNADLEVGVEGGGGVIGIIWRQGTVVLGTDAVLNVPASAFTVYDVEVYDQCGQIVTGQVEVTTGPTPPLSILAEGDTVLCAGEPLLLQVLSVSGGGGDYTYRWSPSGAGSGDAPAYEVEVEDDAYFEVTVTDECGNTADTLLAAVVLDHPPLLISVANDTIVCPGEPVPLWVQVTGGAGASTIEWPGIGSGDAVVWTANNSGIAAVVNVTDECDETVSATVQVAVHPAEAWIDATELGDSQWRFQANTVPTTGVDLEWDLGDGTVIDDQTIVTHTYTDTEAHWVLLFMVTAEGCTAMDSVQTRPPTASIYFPNTFSPNDDGVNERFGGEGVLLDRYELYVFDRWGGIIFESNDLADRWDGTMDGEPVMNGVYQYKYLVKGEKLPLKVGFGHVVLLR